MLFQKSKIIISDERTSHVDLDMEQTIWKVVRDKREDSAAITIQNWGMILVLTDGEVDAFDKFDWLMN